MSSMTRRFMPPEQRQSPHGRNDKDKEKLTPKGEPPKSISEFTFTAQFKWSGVMHITQSPIRNFKAYTYCSFVKK